MNWRDELASAFAKKQEELAEKGFHEQQFQWEASKFYDEIAQPALNAVAVSCARTAAAPKCGACHRRCSSVRRPWSTVSA